MSESRPILDRILTEMGIENYRGISPITKGASGAQLFRLTSDKINLILKFTPIDSPGYIYRRSMREYAFYKQWGDELSSVHPHIVGMLSDGIGVALVMHEYCTISNSSISNSSWNMALINRTCYQISKVHALLWNKPEVLTRFNWLSQPRYQMCGQTVAEALDKWQEVFRGHGFTECECKVNLAKIKQVMSTLNQRLSYYNEFPVCLCHGDFHAGNILTNSSNNPVIVDWQEVRVGCGPEDIAFFLNRASVSGLVIDRAQVIDKYISYLEQHLHSALDASQVKRIIDVSELATLLLDWPNYLNYYDQNTTLEFVNRIVHLNSQL